MPDPTLDQKHEELFFTAIQPGATNAEIDAFIEIHMQLVNEREKLVETADQFEQG